DLFEFGTSYRLGVYHPQRENLFANDRVPYGLYLLLVSPIEFTRSFPYIDTFRTLPLFFDPAVLYILEPASRIFTIAPFTLVLFALHSAIPLSNFILASARERD